jgi:hypothetical protein
MTRLGLIATLLGVSAMASLIGGPVASQQDKRVTIVNGTDRTITAFYASHVSADRWGRDLLTGTIDPGDDFQFNFDDGSTRCKYDLRAVFNQGKARRYNNFDVCNRTRWTIDD